MMPISGRPKKSRKRKARLGRALTKVESLNRLAHMKKEQEEQRIAHEAKIAQLKANRHKGVGVGAFPIRTCRTTSIEVCWRLVQLPNLSTYEPNNIMVNSLNLLSAVCAQLTR